MSFRLGTEKIIRVESINPKTKTMSGRLAVGEIPMEAGESPITEETQASAPSYDVLVNPLKKEKIEQANQVKAGDLVRFIIFTGAGIPADWGYFLEVVLSTPEEPQK
jgi:hypothetical protein